MISFHSDFCLEGKWNESGKGNRDWYEAKPTPSAPKGSKYHMSVVGFHPIACTARRYNDTLHSHGISMCTYVRIYICTHLVCWLLIKARRDENSQVL